MSEEPKPLVIKGDVAYVLANVLKERHVVDRSLESCTYDLHGHEKPVTGPELLKALVAARFTAKEADQVLHIPSGTLIRKAAKLGTPFNSERPNSRTHRPANRSPAQYSALPKAKVAAKVAIEKTKPVKVVKAPPIETLQAPDTAKTLGALAYGECEQYVGTRGGDPVYCAVAGQEIPSRDGMIFRCTKHRTVSIKCAPVG